ncbi:MAG: pyridoxamine 5'-phosphate oxidase [Bacteroidia bacterium]|nr:pyridoxamine 5'-phosphate oxidase [Bacteroidia bacterium]
MDNLQEFISKLREDFMNGSLLEKDIQEDPFAQFKCWLNEAVEAKVPEPQAMNLATASPEGKPSARIVYLREFQNNDFWFYTNYGSRKGQQLSINQQACLTFFWPELERQVRIEGIVKKASSAESDAYFNARPYDSKVGAWASNQSHVLSSRAELEERVSELQKKYTPENITRPPHWGGYVLQAEYYEFWQGRKSRLHDRIAYAFDGKTWHISRLSP